MRIASSCMIVLMSAAPALAAGGDPHGGESNGVFAGTIAQSVAAVIVFMVLLAILWKAAWGPILKGLQDRENRIKEDLESAERSAKQAEQTLGDYQQRLADANIEVRQMIEEGRTNAQKLAAQLKDQTQNEITQMRRRAEADIAAAKERALNEIYAETALLATDVAGRILKRQISETDQQQLVNEAISELGRAGRN